MRVVGIVVVLAVMTTTVHAENDPLTEAIRLEAALDYDAALAIVEREIARGVADRDRLVTLHMFAGKLAAGLDRPDQAEQHFAVVLALAPATTFADGTSPKITEPFDAARTRTTPLRVAATVGGDAISITASPDPSRIVAGIAVELADGRELRETGSLRVVLPTGAQPTRVTALDGFGNRVWSESVAATLAVPPEGLRLQISRPVYARWPFWATGTALALAAGGFCAWRLDSAQDQWDARKQAGADYGDLVALERRGKRWALAANISFGVATATTLVALVTAARGSHQTVILTAEPDAVGFAVTGGF